MTKTTSNVSFRFLLIPLTAILLAFIVSNFLVVLAYVPSDSMADTLPDGSIVLGSRLAYRSEAPKRGDIVFFRHPETGGDLIVKRVAALPGDTLEIRGGTVYLNGQPQDEPYLSSRDTADYPLITVPEGKLMVLGDNRAFSHDSRHFNDPFVSIDDIVGKAFLRVLPSIKGI